MPFWKTSINLRIRLFWMSELVVVFSLYGQLRQVLGRFMQWKLLRCQPMIYGRGPMPAGMQMVPTVFPDGRIGYVLCRIKVLYKIEGRGELPAKRKNNFREDGIDSINYVGFKSNELLQLKQGLHMDISYAKLNELLKSK